MGKDYYKILGVSKDASPEDLKKAYRKLAMKHHPDRNPKNKEEATTKFQEIGEAFDVLNDPKKRKIYDQVGEEGLKGGFGSGGGGASTGNNGGFKYTFTQGDASKIFEQFFGSNGGNIFSNFGGGGFSAMDIDDENDFGNPFGSSTFTSFKTTGNRNHNHNFNRKKKGKTTIHNLYFDLEELYNGKTKTINITRKRVQNGRVVNAKKSLKLPIKAGFKEGTKLTFAKEGDEYPNVIPGDIVFVVKEKDHDRFVRDGDNLIYTHNIKLKDALLGNVKFGVLTLDRRVLRINIKNMITPDYEHVIRGEGMPISKLNGKKGNLIIKFKIEFPTRLNEAQRDAIKQYL